MSSPEAIDDNVETGIKNEFRNFLEGLDMSKSSRVDAVRKPNVIQEISTILHAYPVAVRKHVLTVLAGVMKNFLVSQPVITGFHTVWEEILTNIATTADLTPLIKETKMQGGLVGDQAAETGEKALAAAGQ